MSSHAASAPATGGLKLTPAQLWLLVGVTVIWGFNWPVMKVGVADYPPLTFRALSMWLGIPVLAIGLRLMKVPFAIPRVHWKELWLLALTNMFVWHVFVILGVKALSSGRAAILGYTMPIFATVWAVLLFGERLNPRHLLGTLFAAVGVALLLWHEFTAIGGKPLGAASVLLAAAVWAIGTHLMRRTQMPVPTLTIGFWMTVMTAVVMSVLATAFEHSQWKLPGAVTSFSIGFNAVLIFGFAHIAWFVLARGLPATASGLSVMMIPIIGVFSGATLLNEQLHWQDWAAVVLMVAAIASVLLPKKAG
jgi:drug/metabolite transporter (DMT)-like permease